MAIYLGTNQVGVNTNIGPSGQLAFMKNGNLLTTKTYSFKLSDTNYSSITPSTTSQTLTLPATTYTTNGGTSIICHKIGQSYDGTIIKYTSDLDTKFYMIFMQESHDYAYTVGDSTLNTIPYGIKTNFYYINVPYRYSTSYPITSYGTSSSSSIYTNGTLYKENNAYKSSSGIGIYVNSSSQISIQSNYIDLKISSLTVRADTSKFAVDALNYLNPSNITFNITWKVYQCEDNPYLYIYKRLYTDLYPTT